MAQIIDIESKFRHTYFGEFHPRLTEKGADEERQEWYVDDRGGDVDEPVG